ncbi:hypothetical protein [Pantanalinema sp. GBBB05]|uniref:hypothetical protein n=1 Tax=Pantanalinema sp. GBBB05 TaxID=2604139 RepID=UPI001E1322C6|nr:hypothetical protein [Pantanalinema sp. GBBB05]
MTPEAIVQALTNLFGDIVQTLAPGSYQVETAGLRLLVLLSDDQSWLRILVPIAPIQEARPFLEQLLTANFDPTRETRYALQENVLWGVFQHSREGLTLEDLTAAIQQLIELHQQGLNPCFTQLVEQQMRQIIWAAKRQGQSLEATLQNLDRFYQEGLMGDMNAGTQAKNDTLAAWRYQLERLWDQVEG